MALEFSLTIGVIVVAGLALALVSAAGAALERSKAARIHALAERGDSRAAAIAARVEQPADLLGPLTASRILWATVVVAVMAFVGARWFEGTGPVIGFGLLGGVLVALIEMTVGALATRGPETSALRLAWAVRVNHWLFLLPARLFSLPARLIARSLEAVTPDQEFDIVSLVEREQASGGVEEQESRMIRGVFRLEDKSAREIMVPRLDIIAAGITESLDEIARIIYGRGYSRIPIYRENIDDIVGIVTAKDVLRAISNGASKRLEDLVRAPFFVPESKRLDELLAEMRASRNHIGIVIDEYGGTAGLVTIEDLLEEIVGEIRDEFDVAEPEIVRVSDDEVILSASAPTSILKELFDRDAESEEYDTVGGFLIHELGRLPAVGDEIQTGNLRLRVLSMAARRIKRLRIERTGDEIDAAVS